MSSSVIGRTSTPWLGGRLEDVRAMTMRTGPSTCVDQRPAVASEAALVALDSGGHDTLATEPSVRLIDAPGRQSRAQPLSPDVVTDLEVLEVGAGKDPAADADLVEEGRRHADQSLGPRRLGDDAEQRWVLGDQRLVDVVQVMGRHADRRRLGLLAHQRIDRRPIARFHRAQPEVDHGWSL